LATTFDYEGTMTKYFDPKPTDNIFNASSFLEFMRKFAKKRVFGDGWRETLVIDEGVSGGYTELEVVDRSRKQITDPADWVSGDYYSALTISWKDQKRARSPESKVDLMKARHANAMSTMIKDLTIDMKWGDATKTALAGGAENQIMGMESIIANDNTTTVGGINPATSTYWRNKHASIGGNVALTDIIDMVADVKDGNIKTDVLVTDDYIEAFIWGNLLQAQERYTQGKFNMAEELKMVVGLPIVTDAVFEGSSESAYGDGSTGGDIYFINKDALFLAINSLDDMHRWPMAKPVDQFAYSTFYTHEHMLVCNNRRRLGRLYGITV